MSLPPQFSGHRISGSSTAHHTLELYLDYVCPFSAKIWKQIHHYVAPWLEQEHPGKVQAALAVERLDPSQFASFSDVLFTQQKRYFDEAVVDKSRREQYDSLTTLAATTHPKSAAVTKEAVLALLHIPSVDDHEKSTNTGNQLAADLKYFIKLGRQTGIHVSPTALWDGVIDNSISSGWTLEQWKEFFASKL
ncbi:hypothetical protein BG004_002272 [Podila humilis]|nr:hypothetical protein BG004_002272 [Podila humilis]